MATLTFHPEFAMVHENWEHFLQEYWGSAKLHADASISLDLVVFLPFLQCPSICLVGRGTCKPGGISHNWPTVPPPNAKSKIPTLPNLGEEADMSSGR